MLLKLLTTLMQIPQVSTKYCRTIKKLIITLVLCTHDQNLNRNHIKFCLTYSLCIKGGVEIFPNGQKVYQSALNQKITISGTGFKQGMSFTFEPEIKVRREYLSTTYRSIVLLILF